MSSYTVIASGILLFALSLLYLSTKPGKPFLILLLLAKNYVTPGKLYIFFLNYIKSGYH